MHFWNLRVLKRNDQSILGKHFIENFAKIVLSGGSQCNIFGLSGIFKIFENFSYIFCQYGSAWAGADGILKQSKHFEKNEHCIGIGLELLVCTNVSISSRDWVGFAYTIS